MPKSLHTLDDARQAGQELLAICHNPACRRRQLVDLELVIFHVGAGHQLVPVRGQLHFSERMRCPACGQKGMFIWLGDRKDPEPMTGEGRLNYRVNVLDKAEGLIGTLAKVGHVGVAYAAFNGAIEAYPDRRVVLQEGAVIVLDSRLKVIRGGKA